MKLIAYLLLLLLNPLTSSFYAQTTQTLNKPTNLSNLAIDMQWFLAYLNGEKSEKAFNEFSLKRGYVNIKKRINGNLSGRITTDITVDNEGDGEGDVELRLKYLYLKYQLASFGIFHKPYFEFGLVHRPWLDFEQHINVYRVQGTMFLERNGVISSGDYGIFFHTLLGGEINNEYKKNVNKSFPGKYGSFALGIFNGGGYHALEKNENKSIEGRLTIRPIHKIIPGLQITYHGAIGKGNIAESPDWTSNSGFISYESKSLILTSEFYKGEGNYKGNVIQNTATYEAVPQHGYSLFCEWKMYHEKFSLIGRYDRFIQEYREEDLTTERSIAGFAFHLTKSSKIIVDYDIVEYSSDSKKSSNIFEIAIELKY